MIVKHASLSVHEVCPPKGNKIVRRDIQNNDTQQNDTQHQWKSLKRHTARSVILPNVTFFHSYADRHDMDCCYDECR